MNKTDFLLILTQRLSGLPWEEVDERWAFYNEMIDDRMEEGLSEEEAVAAMGDLDRIIAQILSEAPREAASRTTPSGKRKLRVWEIVLLVLGAPLWLSLLIAAFAVALSLYVILWSVILSLWAADVSLAITVLACIVGGIFIATTGSLFPGLFLIATALVLAGLSLFLLCGCLGATKGLARLTVRILSGKKSHPCEKEER